MIEGYNVLIDKGGQDERIPDTPSWLHILRCSSKYAFVFRTDDREISILSDMTFAVHVVSRPTVSKFKLDRRKSSFTSKYKAAIVKNYE